MQLTTGTQESLAVSSKRPARAVHARRPSRSARRSELHRRDSASGAELCSRAGFALEAVQPQDDEDECHAAPFALDSEIASSSSVWEAPPASVFWDDPRPQTEWRPSGRLRRQPCRTIHAPNQIVTNSSCSKRRSVSARSRQQQHIKRNAQELDNKSSERHEVDSPSLSTSEAQQLTSVDRAGHSVVPVSNENDVQQRQFVRGMLDGDEEQRHQSTHGSQELGVGFDAHQGSPAGSDMDTSNPASARSDLPVTSSIRNASRSPMHSARNGFLILSYNEGEDDIRTCPLIQLAAGSHSDGSGLGSIDYRDLQAFLVRMFEERRVSEERNLEEQILRRVMLESLEDDLRSAQDQQAVSSIPPASECARDALPNVVVIKEDLMDDTTARCPICFERYCPGTRATRMFCGHLFCTGCIWEWLNNANSCPVCRYELPTDSADFEVSRMERMKGRRACLKEGDLNLMSIQQLKQLMLILRVSSDGCNDKPGLVVKLKSDANVEIRPDRKHICYEEAELKALDLCALRSLLKRHTLQPPSVELGEKEAHIEALRRFQAAGMVTTRDLHMCTDPPVKHKRRRGSKQRKSEELLLTSSEPKSHGRKAIKDESTSSSSTIDVKPAMSGKVISSRNVIRENPLTQEWEKCPQRQHRQKKSFAQMVAESSPRESVVALHGVKNGIASTSLVASVGENRSVAQLVIESRKTLVSSTSTTPTESDPSPIFCTNPIARRHESPNHRERSTSGMMALPTVEKCTGRNVDIPKTTTSHPEMDSPLHAPASPLIAHWTWPLEPPPDGCLRGDIDDNVCTSPISFAELALSACAHKDGDIEACDDDDVAVPKRNEEAKHAPVFMRCFRRFLRCLPNNTRSCPRCTCARAAC